MGAPLKEWRAQQSADTVLASSRIPTAGFSPWHSAATLPVLPCCRGMNSRDPFDARLLTALGHPLRLRIVEALTEKGEASPIALAREFKQPLATVSHHVRMLRDLGWVELVVRSLVAERSSTSTVPRRGRSLMTASGSSFRWSCGAGWRGRRFAESSPRHRSPEPTVALTTPARTSTGCR